MGEEQSLRARITALVARVQSLSGDRLRRDEELARLRPLAERAGELERRVVDLEAELAEARAARTLAEEAVARLPPVSAPPDSLGVAVMPGETRSANYNLTLRFRYRDMRGEETERSVALCGVRLETRCYFRGRCSLRESVRDFRADRILGEVIVEDTGEIVPPLDLLVRLLEAGE